MGVASTTKTLYKPALNVGGAAHRLIVVVRGPPAVVPSLDSHQLYPDPHLSTLGVIDLPETRINVPVQPTHFHFKTMFMLNHIQHNESIPASLDLSKPLSAVPTFIYSGNVFGKTSVDYSIKRCRPLATVELIGVDTVVRSYIREIHLCDASQRCAAVFKGSPCTGQQVGGSPSRIRNTDCTRGAPSRRKPINEPSRLPENPEKGDVYLFPCNSRLLLIQQSILDVKPD